jgi:hypothetical protein
VVSQRRPDGTSVHLRALTRRLKPDRPP